MRKAFTRIELLVAIAIIATLAAILFPVFAQAREKDRQATCQSNLQQLSLAVTMYVQEYDGSQPQTIWPEMVQPYVKNEGIYKCPSAISPGYPSNRANRGYASLASGDEPARFALSTPLAGDVDPVAADPAMAAGTLKPVFAHRSGPGLCERHPRRRPRGSLLGQRDSLARSGREPHLARPRRLPVDEKIALKTGNPAFSAIRSFWSGCFS